MAGKTSHKKSSGQAGEAEVKARNQRRTARLLKKFARRKTQLIERFGKSGTDGLSNSRISLLIKWGVAPKRQRNSRPTQATPEEVVNVIEKQSQST